MDTEEELEEFSKKFIVDKDLLRKYEEHVAVLQLKKRQRSDKRKELSEKEKRKGFVDYDWKKVYEDGSLNKVTVSVLDKYLLHYKLRRNLKPKKPEKLSIVPNIVQTHATIDGVDKEQTDDTNAEVEASYPEEEDESDSSGAWKQP